MSLYFSCSESVKSILLFKVKFAMRKLLVLVLSYFVFITNSHGQNLSISSSGQTVTSRTNWSISKTTLTVTGTANILASVIQDHRFNTGSLEVVGITNNLALTVIDSIQAVSLGSEFVFKKNPVKHECD